MVSVLRVWADLQGLSDTWDLKDRSAQSGFAYASPGWARRPG